VGPKVPSGNWTPAFQALAIPLPTELSWARQCHLTSSSCLDSHKSLVLMYHVYAHSHWANRVVTVSCLLVSFTWILNLHRYRTSALVTFRV
jgi:hypothetical protein